MPATTKDTIYIDIEDEITAVIDKVLSAKHKIVALVLPKHATVFQSSVNMKLLKKAASAHKKSLVLISSDKAVLAIASVAKLHTAKTLSTKPEIPSSIVASLPQEAEQITSDTSETPTTPDTEAETDADDAIEIDNVDPETAGVAVIKPNKSKKLIKIPDFSKFSVRVALGISAVIVLFVLWLFGFVILPKATITINTDILTSSVNAQVIARVGNTELNLEENVLPATRSQVDKVDSVTIPATGERNIGERATGRINLTNCIRSDGDQIIPAGTRFSAGSATFETSEQAILPEATFNSSGECRSGNNGDDRTVNAVAIEPGTQSNIGPQALSSSISGIRAFGSDMTGGTSEIISVVSADDVRTAEEQLKDASRNVALTELQANLRAQDIRPIDETLRQGEPTVDVTPAVDAEASEVTVSITINYSLIGVDDEDLAQLIENEVQKNLEDSEQNIRDNGLEAVRFQLIDTPSEADSRLTVETIAKIGPEIDEEALKEEIAGMKRGEIERRIESMDGVRSVNVDYSPAWITTTPKSAQKIEIVFNEEDNN